MIVISFLSLEYLIDIRYVIILARITFYVSFPVTYLFIVGKEKLYFYAKRPVNIVG